MTVDADEAGGLAGDLVPRLAAGVRLKHDAVRGHWVLLAPERVLVLNDTAYAVLRRCDGTTPLNAIAAGVAVDYDTAPGVIWTDLLQLLHRLADERLVRLG